MIEFADDFNNYLRKYENVEIPDLNEFNKELLVWQRLDLLLLRSPEKS